MSQYQKERIMLDVEHPASCVCTNNYSAREPYYHSEACASKSTEKQKQRVEACVFIDATTDARSIKVADVLHLLRTGVTMDMLEAYV